MADVQETRNALWRRDEQIRRWNLSETNSVSAEPRDLNKTAVKFQDGCVFLAACSSGDKKEVENLVKRGADINTANIDGLTALHQACIDDNLEMVDFLVELGADIDACDNEGWTALHATSSCGLVEIAKYLIEKNASIAAVNNDGELAFDLAESDEMEALLVEEMENQGIDAEAAREEEEQLMLRDANQWLNGDYQEDSHWKTGATALHVAAAKGYMKVMRILLQAGADTDRKDFDGWTALHAAAHWGQDEACKLLVENFCNMDIKNNAGQTALDIADSDVVPLLEELKKTQASLKETHIEGSPLSDISMDHKSQSKRRSSVTRMSGDQKQHLVSKSSEDERTKLEELRKVEEEKDDEKKSETESVEEDTSSGIENESSESEPEKPDEAKKKIRDIQPQPKDTDIVEPTVPLEKVEKETEKKEKPESKTREDVKPPPPKTLLPPTEPQTIDFDTVNKSKDENNRPLSSTVIEMNAKNNGDHSAEVSRTTPRDILAENNKENNKEIVVKSDVVKKPQRDFTSKLSEAKSEEKTTSHKGLEKDKSPLKRSVSAPSKHFYKQSAPTSVTNATNTVTASLAETNNKLHLSIGDPVNHVKLRVPDPSSWRAGLRKTGSSSQVPDPSLAGKEDLDKLSRSASSSWIEKKEATTEDSTKSRKFSSTSEGPPESTEATKNKWLREQRFNDFYARYTSLLNTNNKNSNTAATTTTTSTVSNTRPLSHPSILSSSKLSSAGGGGGTTSYQAYVPLSRRRQMEMGSQEKGSTTADSITTPTSPVGSTATITGRRSFEPPKRDEEKEVERKARAKKARETRRSTQGVTKEDIVLAEETLKLANRGQDTTTSSSGGGGGGTSGGPLDKGSNSSKGPVQPEKDNTSSDDKSDKENKPEDSSSSSSLRHNKRQTWSSSDLDIKKDDEYNSRSSLRRSRDNKDTIYSSDTSLSRSLRGPSGTLSSSSITTSTLDTNHKMLSTSTGEPSSYTGSSYGGSRLSGSYGGRDYSSRREEETKDLHQPDVGSASPRYSKKEDKEEKEDPSQKSTAIRTRRKRESRRPTGKITLEDIQGTTGDDKTTTTKPVNTTEEETTKNSHYGSSRYSEPASSSNYDTMSSRYSASRPDRPSSYSGSNYSRPYTSIDSDKGGIDYKKLYEQEKSENERLRKDVDRLKQDLTETRVDLERSKVKTESKTNESREKRALERRISELEEEVKTIEGLKADNQRLKEENGALIRVISKLSK